MHQKLDQQGLIYLYDIEYKESTFRLANFNNEFDSFLTDYILFENDLEKKDKCNDHHNFGRYVSIPFNWDLFDNLNNKNKYETIRRVLKKLLFVNEFNKCVKYFCWFDKDNSTLNLVIIERCRFESSFSTKVTYFKTKHFYKTFIAKVIKQVTQIFKISDYKCNAKKTSKYKLDNLKENNLFPFIIFHKFEYTYVEYIRYLTQDYSLEDL